MKQNTLGSLIRTLRTRNHMTQVQLADKVGVTDKAVSKWERDISCPDITLFPKLADLLGVTVSDLLQGYMEEGGQSALEQIFEMSHDIRTPLHIILGCAELAKTCHEDTERLLRYLDSIRVSGQYLLSVLDRVMQPASMPAAQDEESIPASVEELGERLQAFVPRLKEDACEDSSYRSFAGKRILVTEDIALNREIAAELLKRTGAMVDFAEDGQICVSKVEAASDGFYDLILMDILMPNMDGMEAARRIRSLPDKEKAAVPIIAMTANVSGKDRRAAYEAGMDGFVEKPVFAEKLYAVLKRYLY